MKFKDNNNIWWTRVSSVYFSCISSKQSSVVGLVLTNLWWNWSISAQNSGKNVGNGWVEVKHLQWISKTVKNGIQHPKSQSERQKWGWQWTDEQIVECSSSKSKDRVLRNREYSCPPLRAWGRLEYQCSLALTGRRYSVQREVVGNWGYSIKETKREVILVFIIMDLEEER